MGAETSCCSALDGRAVPLEAPDERQMKRVCKQHWDEDEQLTWESVEECMDELPGWPYGCGERWADERLQYWMKKKKSKKKSDAVVDFKLFKKIVQDALETQEEWNSSPLSAVKSGRSPRSKASRKRAKELERLRDELEDMTLKELQRKCKSEKLKTEGNAGKLVNRLMANEGEERSDDSDSDTDTEPLIALTRGTSQAGSKSPSSTRGNPRQRKKAEEYEKKSRAQLKKLCKDNDIETGTTEEMVGRLTLAALNDDGSSESDSEDEDLSKSEKKIAKKLEGKTEQQLRKKLKKAGRSQKGNKKKLMRRLVRWEDVEEGTSAEEDDSSSGGSGSDTSSDSDGVSTPRRGSRSASPRGSASGGRSPRFQHVYKKYERLDVSKLRDLCRKQLVNPNGTQETLVERLAQAEIDKEAGGSSSSKKEKNPKRQKLRQKYEKMKQYELQRILKDEYKDANGTKEQLVDRILDWKMPKDSDDEDDSSDDTDDGGRRSPRRSSSPRKLFGGGDEDSDDEDSDDGPTYKSVKAKYKNMTRTQLKKMCKDSWLDEDGDKEDLLERLIEYEKPAEGWGRGGSSSGSGKKKKKKKRSSGGGGTDLWGDDDDDDDDSSDDEDSSDDDRKTRKEKKAVKEKLAPLGREKLTQLCRKSKLKATGTTEEMRKRMMKHLMANADLDTSGSSSDEDSDDEDSDDGPTYKSVKAKYKNMTRTQLKKMCKDSWLDEDGDKEDLLERLIEYEKPAEGWGRGGSSSGSGKKRTSSGGSTTDLWGDDAGSGSGRDETPKQRKKRKRKEYDRMSFSQLKDLCRDHGLSPQGARDKIIDRLVDEAPSDESQEDDAGDKDEEMDEWRRAERKLRAKLGKVNTFELRKKCRDSNLNPTGSDEVMIDRLVEDQLPKPEPKIVERNPARRALREKYEKMKIFELQRYLEADGADRNGTKEELILRLLDRQCPETDNDPLIRTPSYNPNRREDAEFGKKYNQMPERKLRELCDENGLSTSGSKRDMVRRLVEAAGDSPGASPRSSRSTSPGLALEPVSEELDGRELRRQAREKYEAMTRQQLIKMCDESWVDATGSQEDMIKRLIQYDASTNDWPPERSSPRAAVSSVASKWNRWGSGGSGGGGGSGDRGRPSVDTASARSNRSPNTTPTAPRGGGLKSWLLGGGTGI